MSDQLPSYAAPRRAGFTSSQHNPRYRESVVGRSVVTEARGAPPTIPYDSVVGRQIVVLWRAALCGGSGRDPSEMCMSSDSRTHDGTASSHHGPKFGIPRQRLSCSDAISSSRQRSTAYVKAGWHRRSNVASHGWICRITPTAMCTNEYRYCLGSLSSPSSTVPLV
jgi:hypothetical protein